MSTRSPTDHRDWVFENLSHAPVRSSLPVEYYIDYEEHVRDQGDRSMCAAFAGAAIREIRNNMRDVAQSSSPTAALRHSPRTISVGRWFSPEFIYYHRENKPISGMYGRNVFKVMQKIGTVPDELYPLVDSDNAAPEPSRELLDVAAQHRISNYARVDTVEGLRRALYNVGPCYMSLPLYDESARRVPPLTVSAPAPRTDHSNNGYYVPRLSIPRFGDDAEAPQEHFWRAIDGIDPQGHAVVVVGYTTDGFILRNSWGARWNGDGHVVFPYSDWPLRWECWVPVDTVLTPRSVESASQKRAVSLSRGRDVGWFARVKRRCFGDDAR